MPDYVSRVPTILQEILSNEKLTRNEICCKLGQLIELGGGTTSAPLKTGIVKLTSGGTATFTTASPLQGTTYQSASLSVISLTTGTVTVTDAHGATTISYPGFSTEWKGTLSNLSITVTGDAIVLVTYTAI